MYRRCPQPHPYRNTSRNYRAQIFALKRENHSLQQELESVKRQLADEKAATVRDFRALQRILGVQPAEQGNAQAQAQAQCYLGFCYESGQDAEKDLEQAVFWYRKSADNGYATAQRILGICYECGQGVEKDLKQAAAWYQKAADQGDAQAGRNLGFCYEYGQGVKKDLKQAAVWYQKAADQGDAQAGRYLERLQQICRGPTHHHALAVPGKGKQS